ncbi:MAG: formate dehydrogenase accessory sulfurtransferase FdhD [Candidatus Binatus sp.]|uniref:formate dehydrogenase accessory sulfurtransferase FdhD n=1 Tax=Candidatus Binatus sp. TaxID=2811406 RepID=UPI00271D78B3|nr:formate dehydrogenase accessory sulfurtransferase FdhD [Candidatus Binatus sp.]MDO8430814.1 formate dehydrogenase accessory sulfurtransferase FdhD [Candidatus Binatus sp.]
MAIDSTDRIRRRDIVKWQRGRTSPRAEDLAVEEPLEIRLGGRRFTLTMRTPGHDEELAAGFLFAEGFIDQASELGEIRRVRGRKGEPEPNAIDVILNVPAERMRARLKRNFVMSSSCGVCGKTSIDSIRRRVESPADSAVVSPAVLLTLAAKLREGQQIFAATGGLHGAAIFDLDGAMLAIREDVGRHNAVDKAIGYALANAMLPLSRHLMMVSGRLSFEIVQKAAAAGVPILAAVSAPSSLAVELADEIGTTLVGFLRNGSFNIYTRPDRISG